ncbi:MAG TPA: MerR family transcriptional regulator [Gaiellaceae bacterium]|nr:MerR family transcriptional regulator [Gaiellaceae bacterium]
MSVLVSIGDFSRMTLVSVKALRHYHELGLLPPAEIDSETGYRRYDVAQVPTAQVIRRLRELGMPLDSVRVVIEAPDVPARNEAISAHLSRMEGELEQTRATVKSLRLLLDEKPPPKIAVDYRISGPGETLAIRDEIAHDDMFDWLGSALTDLRSALESTGARRTGADAALFSSELMEDEFGEIVAVVPVKAAEPSGRVERLELPRVEYAVAVHAGSLEDIDRTYGALGAVVAERSIGVQGPIRETYLVGAFETPDEAEHRTEIGWPVFLTA